MKTTKAITIFLGIATTCMIAYLHLLNTYMAYQASGVIAAIATFVFLPISIIVWFFIVVINNGPWNIYCAAWAITMILSVVCNTIRHKR